MSKNHAIVLNIVSGLQSHYPQMDPNETLERTQAIVGAIDVLAAHLDDAEASDEHTLIVTGEPAPKPVKPEVEGVQDAAALDAKAFAALFSGTAPNSNQGNTARDGIGFPLPTGRPGPFPTPTPPGIVGT